MSTKICAWSDGRFRVDWIWNGHVMRYGIFNTKAEAEKAASNPLP